jgi:SAM-dependent methyltransferase
VENNSYVIKSEEWLRDLSNRLHIDFQPVDPNEFEEWVRPGPVQRYSGPLPYKSTGYDPVCGEGDTFVSKSPWFRDSLKAKKCKTMPRERSLAFVLANLLPHFKQAINIMESSPNSFGLSKKLRDMFGPDRYTGTQYSASVPCGAGLTRMNTETSLDLENQICVPDNSFDIVISQDVFEHIYNPAKAFKEIARTLKPGGFHIFTVPITSKNFGSFIFAERVDDAPPSPYGMTVKLHAPPEIHGNPMGEGGSLLTRQWGYDIVDFIRENSGLETTVVYVDSQELGITDAEYRDVLISRKEGVNNAFPDIWTTLDSMQCGHHMLTCTTSTDRNTFQIMQ